MPSIYPKGLDTFIPALDGWTPIVPDDMNDVATAIENTQRALGWGLSKVYRDTGTGVYYGDGPKGQNASLKERLDEFLDPDGSMRDVVFVTGEAPIHAFNEGGVGVEVSFGKTLGGSSIGDQNAYGGWFQCYAEADPDSSSLYPSYLPAHFWIGSRGPRSCIWYGRGLDLSQLSPVKSEIVKWACLMVGSQVPGTYINA